MTEQTTDGNTPAQEAVSLTLNLVKAFEALLGEQIGRGGDTTDMLTAKQVGDHLSLLGKLSLRLAEEETRLETQRERAAGAAQGRALDLEAARSEVGRRLACLREQKGGGGVC